MVLVSVSIKVIALFGNDKVECDEEDRGGRNRKRDNG